jgi:hypothetical protein
VENKNGEGGETAKENTKFKTLQENKTKQKKRKVKPKKALRREKKK